MGCCTGCNWNFLNWDIGLSPWQQLFIFYFKIASVSQGISDKQSPRPWMAGSGSYYCSFLFTNLHQFALSCDTFYSSQWHWNFKRYRKSLSVSTTVSGRANANLASSLYHIQIPSRPPWSHVVLDPYLIVSVSWMALSGWGSQTGSSRASGADSDLSSSSPGSND